MTPRIEPSDDYLTVSQAAAIIGIAQPNVSKAVARGRIPAIRLARQGVFILRRDALAYKREREKREAERILKRKWKTPPVPKVKVKPGPTADDGRRASDRAKRAITKAADDAIKRMKARSGKARRKP